MQPALPNLNNTKINSNNNNSAGSLSIPNIPGLEKKKSLLEEIMERKKVEMATGDKPDYDSELATEVLGNKAHHDSSWVDSIDIPSIDESFGSLENNKLITKALPREGELDLHQIENVLISKDKAISFYKRGKYIEALAELDQAVQLLPGDLELLFQQALCLYKIGNLDRAEKIFSELYRLDENIVLPNLPKVYTFVLLKQKKYSEVEAFLEQQIKRSVDIQYQNMYGYALERQNKIDQAITVFEKIIKYDPFNANACNSLAYCFCRKEVRFEDAIDYSKRALKKEPQNANYLDTLAMINAKKGNTNMAQKLLRKAVQLEPQNQEVLLHLSEILHA